MLFRGNSIKGLGVFGMYIWLVAGLHLLRCPEDLWGQVLEMLKKRLCFLMGYCIIYALLLLVFFAVGSSFLRSVEYYWKSCRAQLTLCAARLELM